MSILLKNCAEIVISTDGKPKYGKELSIVETVKNQDLLIRNGKIEKIGTNLEMDSDGQVQIIDW